jgi:hypothetical protein
LLALGGGGALWVRGAVPEVAGLRGLSAAQYRTFSNIVAAMFPPGGPIPVDVGALDLARAFDGFVADEPSDAVRELGLALTLVEVAPLVLDSRGTTFSRLSDEERAAYWSEWAASDRLEQRQISLGFRKFIHMVFYDTPEVWPHIGYGGPSLQRLAEQNR